jgi:hypothetical protein
MNQAFISFLHLTDIRVGFFDGHRESRTEVPISALDSLLAKVVKSGTRDQVERRSKEVAALEARVERDRLVHQLVKDADENRAKILERLTCPCGEEEREAK